MEEETNGICLQCKRKVNSASYRLVVDSCGHKKCRICLLDDEDKCKQCLQTSPKIEPKVENNNHGGVIAYPNITKHEKSQNINLQTNVSEKQLSNGSKQQKPSSSAKKSKEEIIQKSEKLLKKIKISKKCVKRAYNMLVIPDHISTLNPLGYQCNLCNKIFSTRSHIKYHVYCTGKVPKPYTCTFCSKKFITRTHMNIHILKHSKSNLFTCEVCKKSFSDQTKLKRHQVVHTHLKTHICSECGKGFKSKDLLRVHSRTHKIEKFYKCSMCEAKFNHASNLKKHLTSHSGEKIHMCDQCGKRFKLKWALIVHRKSHLRIRPHKCTDCTKAFINHKDLQRHQLIHLDSKLYSCSVCKTEFKRKDNLLRHIKNTHPGKNAEPIKITVPSAVKFTKPVVDNPNAIKVITASPIISRSEVKNECINPIKRPDLRPGTVINGPLKLAFKTDAFKNNYNIQRDYEPPSNSNDSFDLAQSVDICQKILTPHNPPRNIIRKVSDVTSSEICQKILTPFSTPPLHYETSFMHKKHGSVKNIKFKLPADYVNLIDRTDNTPKDIFPQKAVNSISPADLLANEIRTYAEFKTMSNAASVIVNTNSSQAAASDMHWRRRTLQNLNLRNA